MPLVVVNHLQYIIIGASQVGKGSEKELLVRKSHQVEYYKLF